MPGFTGLRVDAFSGDRWDLAVELLASGEADVWLGNVIMRRNVHGPAATGRISFDILCSGDPRFLTSAIAQADVSAGLAVVAGAQEDTRFAALVHQYGLDLDYIAYDGYESFALAALAPDGTTTWVEGREPR